MKVIRCNLRGILKERGIEQRQLAEMTGLSVRTISELVNNKMKHYPKKALEKIASVLDIDDINKIITFVDDIDDI